MTVRVSSAQSQCPARLLLVRRRCVPTAPRDAATAIGPRAMLGCTLALLLVGGEALVVAPLKARGAVCVAQPRMQFDFFKQFDKKEEPEEPPAKKGRAQKKAPPQQSSGGGGGMFGGAPVSSSGGGLFGSLM